MRSRYRCQNFLGDWTSERKKKKSHRDNLQPVNYCRTLPVDVSALSTFTNYFPRSVVPDFAQLRQPQFNECVDGVWFLRFFFFNRSRSPKVRKIIIIRRSRFEFPHAGLKHRTRFHTIIKRIYRNIFANVKCKCKMSLASLIILVWPLRNLIENIARLLNYYLALICDY